MLAIVAGATAAASHGQTPLRSLLLQSSGNGQLDYAAIASEDEATAEKRVSGSGPVFLLSAIPQDGHRRGASGV